MTILGNSYDPTSESVTFSYHSAAWAGLEDRVWNGSGATISSVAKSGFTAVDSLLTGVKWNGPITYSAPGSIADYPSGYFGGDPGVANTNGFLPLTALQLTAFNAALNVASSAAGFSVHGFTHLNVTFIGGFSGNGTIRAVNMDAGDPSAFAFDPSNSGYGGDIFFGNAAAGLQTPRAGNFGWHTMLHEVGHALGLLHPHDTDGLGIATPTQYDSGEFTVMSYRSFINGPTTGNYSNGNWSHPQTYMMLDIAALQHMYGADFTANGGSTRYTWRPNSGDMQVNGTVAINPSSNKIFATIWDGGGYDTYDLSAYTTAVTINLAPGGFSVFSQAQLANLGGGPNGGLARGNIFNAYQHKGDPRSLIEAAVGGSAGDTITGNVAANNLYGLGGADRLFGADGNDLLSGDAGNDYLYGGAGADRLYAGAGNDSLMGNPGNDRLYGGNGRDDLIGADGNDYLYGEVDNDRLFGGNGVDYLYGAAGVDRLYGGDGIDRLYGGAGNDELWGDAGNDLLYGGVGNDRLLGHAGVDRLYGDAGNDTLLGYDGNDRLYGAAGNDTFYGGNGSDILQGAAGNDRLYGGFGNDVLYGGAGNDILAGDAGNDQIYGGAGNDTIRGGNGNDLLLGDTGNDIIHGGNGNDRIYGAGGNDRLYGNGGSDRLYGGNSDWLDGGAGIDYAHLSGRAANYTITRSGTTTFVEHSGGTMLLQQVEFIVFSDQTIAI